MNFVQTCEVIDKTLLAYGLDERDAHILASKIAQALKQHQTTPQGTYRSRLERLSPPPRY